MIHQEQEDDPLNRINHLPKLPMKRFLTQLFCLIINLPVLSPEIPKLGKNLVSLLLPLSISSIFKSTDPNHPHKIKEAKPFPDP
jgi:hypothetical protein